MPIPTPFHARTAALNRSHQWREWAGYLSAAKFSATHEFEYYSVRSAAGIIDVSPLYKYEISGPDAERLVNRIITRDIRKAAVKQIFYSPWCDEEGKIIDDGTIARLGKDRFRMTAADPCLRWFQDCGYGMNVQVEDVSTQLAALALQGPKSRELLKQVVKNADLDGLKYYHLAEGQIDNFPVTITRTGYTGDLGFELWVSPQHAEKLWDVLLDKGHDYGITPFGLIALDMLRIEAGLLLIEVDYKSTFRAVIEDQKSSPFEVGLGWTVDLTDTDFIGKNALAEEKKRPSRWSLVGLDINWPSLEKAYAKIDLPPQVPGQASRDPKPIYKNGKQVGQATSITFSPILKKYIALASIDNRNVSMDDTVELEITVEYSRETAQAKIVKPQFFNPTRKRSTIR